MHSNILSIVVIVSNQNMNFIPCFLFFHRYFSLLMNEVFKSYAWHEVNTSTDTTVREEYQNLMTLMIEIRYNIRVRH